MSTTQPVWFVYIVFCSDASLYTGITTDIYRRIQQHNSILKGGARYTRSRQPVRLVYSEEFATRSLASKREFSIKRLSPTEKRALVLASSTTVTS